MQRGLESDGGRVRELVAQRQRPLRGQLGQEAIRERLQVLVALSSCPPMVLEGADDTATVQPGVQAGGAGSRSRPHATLIHRKY